MPRDPVAWAAASSVETWSKQREILASVWANKRTVVQAGAGIGKSFAAALTVAAWVSTHPVNDTYVWTTAPGGDQVGGILWEEIRKLHAALRLPGRVGLDNKWRVDGVLVASGRKPADKAKGSDEDPDTGQGFHGRYLLVVLDDAGGLDEWLWTSAENITTGDDCRILADGNPDHAGSKFARVCGGDQLWNHIKMSVFDSPNFTGEQVSEHLARTLTTRQWAADRLSDWGKEDRRYISKVLGNFPSDHPDQIIPAADARACQLAEERAPSELVPVELGVDVGGGKDKTVIRERRGIQAGRRWAKLTGNPAEAGPFLISIIRQTGALSVKVDGTGIGWGLVGEVRNAVARGELDERLKIYAVKTGDPPTNPKAKKIYKNLKAQIWWEVGREASQQRAWDLSVMEEADQTMTEFLMPRWFPDARGLIQVESKDDIRDRSSGASPDDADALLLAFYTPADALGDDWLSAMRKRR